jgi:uncharacterized membrane-anchored protein YjiN (DUF445 family)
MGLRGPPPGISYGPRKMIDKQQFEQLCQLQCTKSEIASFFKMHIDTLDERLKEEYGETYSELYKRFSEIGKCSIRRNQFVLSRKNAAMAIWLGKQYLEQKDDKDDSKLTTYSAVERYLSHLDRQIAASMKSSNDKLQDQESLASQVEKTLSEHIVEAVENPDFSNLSTHIPG